MYKISKRLLDIFVSLISLFMLMPIFIPVILILRFTGEKEIFYFQNRVGLNNDEIKIFKFATMLKDSENIGTGIYTAKNDPRILPFGNFLRKTKINELPQILNVLNGDISLVGPRPLIKRTFELYSKTGQEAIASIKPGLTGIGSIVFRNEEELLAKAEMNLEEFYKQHITPHKEELELWYLDKKSFVTDLKIIIATAWLIVFKSSSIKDFFFKDLPKNKYI